MGVLISKMLFEEPLTNVKSCLFKPPILLVLWISDKSVLFRYLSREKGVFEIIMTDYE